MTSVIDSDPLFTSLCSQKTLQAHNEGFFNLFYQSVCENFEGENWLNDVYKKLPDDRAKLLALYDDPTVAGPVLGTLEHVQQVYRKKDAKFSWQRRDQSQQCLVENKLGHALILACQAGMYLSTILT
jgi:SET and MYND domain-containing protein 4